MSRRTITGSYLSFLRGIPSFLGRPPVTLEDAAERIRIALERRESTFLDLIGRAVFGHASSPYLPLFDLAGCELGDVHALVRAKGVEGALAVLRSAGVFIRFEEFKGRSPVERAGRVLHVTPEMFDNPLLTDGFVRGTSGTTGRSVPIRTSLADIEERCPGSVLAYQAHGLRGIPTASWWQPPAGIGIILQDARAGQRHERWFAPPARASRTASARYRAFWGPIVAAGYTAGVRLPMPRRATDDAVAVARWAVARTREHGRCLVRTPPSWALRAATAASDEGLGLEGVTFVGAGEPPTPAKVAGIRRAGARWVPTYTAMETGKMGFGCASPVDGSDVHFFHHLAALVTSPREIPEAGVSVPSFHVTTLRRGAPKMLLNVELDDYGTVERRACGCPLGDLGFTTHLREIFSFSKLTGEGVTFVGSNMMRIVEEVLPSHYGGTALDYQFVEEEDEKGFTRLTLVHSDRVSLPDEASVVALLLDNLGDTRMAASVGELWRRAGTLRVRRAEPTRGRTGKVLPLVSRRHR